jgi:hypothetical protein
MLLSEVLEAVGQLLPEEQETLIEIVSRRIAERNRGRSISGSYRSLRIDESAAPITPSELEEVEKKIGIRLPDHYRRFLLARNGGIPIPGIFHFKEESGPYTDSQVQCLLAIHSADDQNDFETFYERYKLNEIRLPAELIPIGNDLGGNLICIADDGPNLGAVYFWDHEEEEDTATFNNVHLIADSFDEFLSSLSA